MPLVRLFSRHFLSLVLCGFLIAVFGLPASAAAGKAQPVTLQVVVAEGAKPLREAVTFNIARIAPGGRVEPVDTKIGAPLKIALPQGRYQVVARYGDTAVTTSFEVAGKPLTHRISLNAGWAHLRVIPHRGAVPMASAIEWEILTYGRDATGQRQRVASAKSPNPRVVLPAGHYVVQARTRDALAKHTIEITAGHTYKYTLDLNAGAVAFSAVRGRGGKVVEETVNWQVFKASDASLSKPVTTRSAASGRFWLREGRYIVLAQQGQWNGRASVEVRSGNERKISVELK